ncbi:MAG TPA: hypothetical protein ENK85_09005 [Saprospiraceae bacterium]|nr:hypothetical protein [Saprospiraceae bacterium]
MNYLKYKSQEMQGLSFTADFDYYFSNSFGVGAFINRFVYNDELMNQDFILSNGAVVKGDFANRIRMNFYGAKMCYRSYFLKDKAVLGLNLGVGYLGYKDMQSVVESYKVQGKSFGSMAEIDLNFFILENFSLGLDASWINGVLWKYRVINGGHLKVIELNRDDYIDISRSNISFTVSYYW